MEKPALTTSLVNALSASVRPARDRYGITEWIGGVDTTRTGEPWNPGSGRSLLVTLSDFARGLDELASQRHAKGEGCVFAHGLSRWQGSSDIECSAVDWLYVDCDGAGEWHALRAALDAAEVSYVAQRSGGDSERTPKWHLHIPLANALEPPAPNIEALYPSPAWDEHVSAMRAWKKTYQAEGEHILHVLENVGGVRLDPGTVTALLHRAYPATRRTENAKPHFAEIHDTGRTLDWRAFLAATGYVPPAPRAKLVCLATATAEQKMEHGERVLAREAERVRRAPEKKRNDTLYVSSCRIGAAIAGGLIERERSVDVLTAAGLAVGLDESEIPSTIESGLRRGAEDPAGVPDDEAYALMRVREQLEANANQGEPCALADVRERVHAALEDYQTDVIRDRTTAKSLAIVAPPGSGKTHATVEWVAQNCMSAVIVAPTHELAGEIAHQLRKLKGTDRVQHHRSVLRVLNNDGSPACARHGVASDIERSGMSVQDVLCRTCPKHKGCPALAKIREESGRPYGVTVPQLGMNDRRALAKRMVDGEPTSEDLRRVTFVVDERVDLTTQVCLSRDQLRAALEALDDDEHRPAETREFHARKLAPIRRTIRALLDGDLGCHIDEIKSARRFAPLHTQAIRSWGLRSAETDPRTPEGLTDEGRTHVELSQANQHRPAPLSERPDDARRLAPTLLVVRGMDALLKQIEFDGDLRSVEWHKGRLNLRVPSDLAEEIHAHGGVLLDATLDDDVLKVFDANATTLRLLVPDPPGVEISRTVIVNASASRKRMAPRRGKGAHREIEWSRITPSLRFVRDLMPPEVRSVLLVVFKDVESALPGSEAGESIEAWRAAGVKVDVRHYGALLGVNEYKDHDACITIGDPRPDVSAERRTIHALLGRLEPTESELYEAMTLAAARELEQVHGRLRDCRRTKPAWHAHIGAIVPRGWTTDNTTVVERGKGWARREATGAVLTPAEIGQRIDALGGERAAARASGVSRAALQRYRTGKRVAPADLDTRLR